jgi:hypothetical protein
MGASGLGLHWVATPKVGLLLHVRELKGSERFVGAVFFGNREREQAAARGAVVEIDDAEALIGLA